jgi:hypothetical protein
LEKAVEDFALNLRIGGWPQRVAENRPHPAASISALQIVNEAAIFDRLDPVKLESAMQSLLSAWRRKDLFSQMTAWDWQCAALLASGLPEVGKIAPAQSDRYINEARKIRQRWLGGGLKESDLRELKPHVRAVATYPLTEGLGFRPRWKMWLAELPHNLVMELILWAAVTIIITVISFLVVKISPF